MVAQKIDFPMEEITALCSRNKVRELALFGSVLRSDFRPDSDIDILVEFDPDAEVGFMTLARLARELSALLHHKVDLVPKTGLKSKIRGEVLAGSKVLYAA
jgi:predicted nucleotidyltransferase